jgi:hypothetical protein
LNLADSGQIRRLSKDYFHDQPLGNSRKSFRTVGFLSGAGVVGSTSTRLTFGGHAFDTLCRRLHLSAVSKLKSAGNGKD